MLREGERITRGKDRFDPKEAGPMKDIAGQGVPGVLCEPPDLGSRRKR